MNDSHTRLLVDKVRTSLDHSIRQNNPECTLTREKDESIGFHTMHTCHVEYAASIKAVGTTTACIRSAAALGNISLNAEDMAGR